MEAIRTSTSGPFERAVDKVKDAFKEQGFGTLSEIDIQATLREKIGQEIEPYKILGVCNPRLASQAIATEHEVGVYMPCTVLVHECSGRINVCVQPPEQVVANTGNTALAPILAQVRESVEKAFARLG